MALAIFIGSVNIPGFSIGCINTYSGDLVEVGSPNLDFSVPKNVRPAALYVYSWGKLSAVAKFILC